MSGTQSSLSSSLHTVHEQGGGCELPPQDNSPLKALARTITDKGRGRAISLKN